MVDSEPLAKQAWQRTLAHYDKTLEDDLYRRIIGLRLDETAKLLQQELDVDTSAVKLSRQKEKYLSDLRAQGIPPMPGLNEMMLETSRQGLPWAVATSSPKAHALEILDQLNYLSSCSAIAGGDEVTRGKPAPDIYLLATERLGMPPGNCLALEDSNPGARAAVAAGIRTVVVPNSQTNDHNFDFVYEVYDSLSDVARDLERILKAES